METLQEPTKTKARKEHRCNFCLLPIEKGSVYLNAVYKYDGLYSWKSHLDCSHIASHLNMFDECDEGVTDYAFREFIVSEFYDIMSKTNTEIWESKSYQIPPFKDQLAFVINHHLAAQPLTKEPDNDKEYGLSN